MNITDFTFTGYKEVSCRYGMTILHTEFDYHGDFYILRFDDFSFFETNTYDLNGNDRHIDDDEEQVILNHIAEAIFVSKEFAEMEQEIDHDDIHQQWREDELMGN